MSFTLLGILNAQAAGGVSYWLSVLGGSGTTQGDAITTDSAGNSYTGASALPSWPNHQGVAIKRDPAGEILYKVDLGGGDYESYFSVALDSNDNLYAVGHGKTGGVGNLDFLVVKYNSSGVIQWQKNLGGQYSNDTARFVAVDSNDDILVFGRSNDPSGAGSYDMQLVKYNSSGSVLWQKYFGTANGEYGFGLALDSSDNIYVAGEELGGPKVVLAKFNSSGAVQWQRTLALSTFDGIEPQLQTDASGNVYLVCRSGTNAAYNLFIAKYNSSGTIQWQRSLGGSGDDQGIAVAVDSTGNAYASGFTRSAGVGQRDFLIAKYNSSGAIQWQRTLGYAGANEVSYGIALDSSDNLYVTGEAETPNTATKGAFLAKLPNDGSLTGTYVLDTLDFVYAASALTDQSTSFTEAAASLSVGTSVLVATTSSMTPTTFTASNYLVEL